jgi:hypothetical protein
MQAPSPLKSASCSLNEKPELLLRSVLPLVATNLHKIPCTPLLWADHVPCQRLTHYRISRRQGR